MALAHRQIRYGQVQASSHPMSLDLCQVVSSILEAELGVSGSEVVSSILEAELGMSGCK